MRGKQGEMSESLHSFWHGQDPFAIHEYVNNELNSRLLYRLTPGRRKGAVIVCAGGAYIWKSPREDWPVADAYARAGYQTYVLDYTADMQDAPLGTLPLRQLAWAMRIVRENNIQEGRPDSLPWQVFMQEGICVHHSECTGMIRTFSKQKSRGGSDRMQ